MSFAVVFPGQGAQSVGMLSALAEAERLIGETFAEAADILGVDLWALSQAGPDSALADTRVTQPLMFVSDIAVWRVCQAKGLGTPTVVAGHSLGEFSALVAAGALPFSDALKLVNRRAQLMAEAVPDGEGGMAALIGMSDEDVIALCADVSGERICEAVNFNAPGQVAISGHLDAVEKAVAQSKGRGARKAVMLAVSVPNHSSLMRGAGLQLAEFIDTLNWHEPTIPVVQNAQASAPASLSDLLDSLKLHVYSPVKWTQSIEHIRDRYQVSLVVESGPGKVLTGMGKRIDRKLPTVAIESPETLAAALDAVQALSAESA